MNDYAIRFRSLRNGRSPPASKADSHADVTRCKAEALVEALRVDAARMCQKFDKTAAARLRFRHRPLHQLLADAAAAAVGGDADILEQASDAALRADAGQDRELQAADHPALALGDHELEILIALDPLERHVIDRRQRLLHPLAGAPEVIVSEHGDDRGDVLAARGADGDGLIVHAKNSATQRAGGKPRKASASPIQRRIAGDLPRSKPPSC